MLLVHYCVNDLATMFSLFGVLRYEEHLYVTLFVRGCCCVGAFCSFKFATHANMIQNNFVFVVLIVDLS